MEIQKRMHAKTCAQKKQRETIFFIWMEVLVFAQDKHNIHLKTKNKQKLSFLWFLRHTLSIRTFFIHTDTLKHERTITYEQCLTAANQTLKKPSVNIYSVHDPVSRTSTAVIWAGIIYSTFGKHKTTFSFGSSGIESKSAGECRRLDKCLGTVANFSSHHRVRVRDARLPSGQSK